MKKTIKNIKLNLKYIDINSRNFMEGVVIKRYSDGKLYAGKCVNPDFEEIIDNLGRYENYPARNEIKMYTEEEFKEYLRNHIEKPGKIEISNKKKLYEKYLEMSSYWNSFINVR
jgi:hypothetical protein